MNRSLTTDPMPDGRIQIFPEQETASRHAAHLLVGWLDPIADPLLVAATGDSPTLAYDHLAEEAKVAPERFRGLRLLKLDEWGGLEMDDPATCESYLRHHLVKPLGLSPDRYMAFESNPRDPVDECKRIAAWVSDEGPIDVCVLGLGRNGHLAMNEP
ncbi:MAG: 6-phosphogluconolactonase, partial [Chthoniobacteraceae bacterium]